MTKKDFELIAAALWRSKPLAILNPKADAVRQSVYEMCARNLADALATTNPRFDRARFLQACGVAS
jgi:hypothetical protein